MKVVGRQSFVLALIFAVVGGVATLSVLSSAGKAPEQAKDQVVVAARAISAGEELTKDDLSVRDMPKGSIPDDALVDANAAAGMYAAVPLSKGQFLLQTMVGTTPPGGRLAAVIPDGKVAVSVAVNDVISTGGLLAPGDHVDVLGVVTKDTASDAGVVLHDILVLAVSDNIVGTPKIVDDGKKKVTAKTNPESLDKTVTLAVTLDEARRLVQVDEVGTLRLALRQRQAIEPTVKR